MARPIVTEIDLLRYISETIIQRGKQYYRDGAVESMVLRGDVLMGEVQGSEIAPYLVSCTLTDTGITQTVCTCPYGAWCKHVVALCLAYSNEPMQVREAPTLDSLLADLDSTQLRTLVAQLATQDMALIEEIEALVQTSNVAHATPTAQADDSPSMPPPPDLSAIKRRVRSSMRAFSSWHASETYGSSRAGDGDVAHIVAAVQPYIVAGNSKSALQMLETIIDEYLAEWESMDDSDGDASSVLYDVGDAFTEALLCAPLTRNERDSWLAKLDAWQSEVSDYGVEDAFAPAIAAAQTGWDDRSLQAILAGAARKGNESAPEEADDDTLQTLNLARLRILERAGRLEEYLNLAHFGGLLIEYTTMLVRLGRAEEAAKIPLRTVDEAFALAQALDASGDHTNALAVAERGLGLPEPTLGWRVSTYGTMATPRNKAALAVWLRERAVALGDDARALHAAEVAFYQEMALANYQRAQALAGTAWPDLRERLLDRAAQTRSYAAAGAIAVLLHEQRIDAAIAIIDSGAMPHIVAALVAEAAITTHPEWVITLCRKQAEPIMNEGRAGYYDAAAEWLAKARKAYLNLGRKDEWNVYLQGLLTTHARKYKLMPLLKALKK